MNLKAFSINKNYEKRAQRPKKKKEKPTDELVKIFTWKAARKLRAEAKTKQKKKRKVGEKEEEEPQQEASAEAKAM